MALTTIVATDGSCINNGHDKAVAGAGIFFRQNDPRNTSIRLPEPITQSNQTAEMIAAKVAPEIANPLKLETDSKYVISHLTTSLRKMEIIRAMVAKYRMREATTTITWVEGHNGYRQRSSRRLSWKCHGETASRSNRPKYPHVNEGHRGEAKCTHPETSVYRNWAKEICNDTRTPQNTQHTKPILAQRQDGEVHQPSLK
jgi:ribonuclease HI